LHTILRLDSREARCGNKEKKIDHHGHKLTHVEDVASEIRSRSKTLSKKEK